MDKKKKVIFLKIKHVISPTEAGESRVPVWFQARPAATADTPEETEHTPAPVQTRHQALKTACSRLSNYSDCYYYSASRYPETTLTLLRWIICRVSVHSDSVCNRRANHYKSPSAFNTSVYKSLDWLTRTVWASERSKVGLRGAMKHAGTICL